MMKYASFVLFLIGSCYGTVHAQTGTYYRQGTAKAECTITVIRTGNRISAEAFAWWGAASGRNGNFSGQGLLINNNCVLKGSDIDASCSVGLAFKSGSLEIAFNSCMEDNLPQNFNGSYTKITDMVPGRHKISSAKAYFYGKQTLTSLTKAYLVSGNQVQVELENIRPGGWVYVNYRNEAGKITTGYMRQDRLGTSH